MKWFTDYDKAANYARRTATETGNEMLLRKARKLSGPTEYVVQFATKGDADYYKSEVIKPGEPLTIEVPHE